MFIIRVKVDGDTYTVRCIFAMDKVRRNFDVGIGSDRLSVMVKTFSRNRNLRMAKEDTNAIYNIDTAESEESSPIAGGAFGDASSFIVITSKLA